MKFKETKIGIIPENWEVCSIKEVADIITDYVANGSFASLAENVKYKDEEDEAILIRLVDYNNDFQGKFVFIDEHAYNFLAKTKLFGNEIIISNVGANVGTVFRCPYLKHKMSLGPNSIMVKFKENDDFYFHWLRGYNGQQMLKTIVTGSAQPKFNKTNFKEMLVPVPPLEEQIKIAKILNGIDEKIEINKKINNNLEQQVLTLYQHNFIDTINELRKKCKMEEYFDVSIGKTPPRKEPRWFSNNLQDITWISISDMGNSGLYISNSSEQLTREAIEHHNIKIVPDNTVLLSFKLTVGRVAITDGEVTTNEAIAHFKTNQKEINEYLYCYLKHFKFETMGSTSSIATAINSKIIKSMLFIVPTDVELDNFHNTVAPMFRKIKDNLIEISNLAYLRDSLLPKLMSGEIDVSEIDI